MTAIRKIRRRPTQLSAFLLAASLASPAWPQVLTAAVVTGAYDGDTLYVDADLWPGLVWTGSVRVKDVDAPEINGQCEKEKQWAILARDYVRGLLMDRTVYLARVENDKYGGRVAATVGVPSADGTRLDNLTDLLISNNYARAYAGGAREGWCGADLTPPGPPEETRDPGHPLELYDDNGNGRISCSEARTHGIAPVHSGHPAYPYMTDGNSDGVVCE